MNASLNSASLLMFPEIDQVRFFALTEAGEKTKESERPFLERLEKELGQS